MPACLLLAACALNRLKLKFSSSTCSLLLAPQALALRGCAAGLLPRLVSDRAAPLLTDLSLAGCSNCGAQFWASPWPLSQLTRLYWDMTDYGKCVAENLAKTDSKAAAAGGAAAAPALAELDCGRSCMSPEAAAALAACRLPALQALSVKTMERGALGALSAAAWLAGLTSLCVQDTGVDDTADEEWMASATAGVSQLQALTFAHTRAGPSGRAFAALLAANTGLRSLSIKSYEYCAALDPLRALVAAPLPLLTSITFDNVPFTREAVAPARWLRQLRELDLELCGLSKAADVRGFASLDLRSLTSLRVIDACARGAAPGRAAALAGAAWFPRLRRLVTCFEHGSGACRGAADAVRLFGRHAAPYAALLASGCEIELEDVDNWGFDDSSDPEGSDRDEREERELLKEWVEALPGWA